MTSGASLTCSPIPMRGAMYGLGYATAQERGFQMTYGLRIMQGRLAEVLGDRPRGGRKETALGQ